MDLKSHFLQTVVREGFFKPGDRVLVAVSGGADSVCLLHLLYSFQARLGISLQVAHYNHQLRPTANRDEAFVKLLAKNLDLPISVYRRNKPNKQQAVSEEKAREWRFKFLVKTAVQIKAQCIALAHHQDDLAETVLMRLLRGAGLLGLRGILTDNTIAKQRFIRPLLTVSRAQIEIYLKQNKLTFCQDETNQQTHYLRNKIRLKLLPQLTCEYNPNLSSVLTDLAYTAQADYDYLLSQAQMVFAKQARCFDSKVSFKLKLFLKNHPSIQRLMLRLAYERIVKSVNQLAVVHIQEVEDLLNNRPVGSEVHWPKAVTVIKTKEELVLTLL